MKAINTFIILSLILCSCYSYAADCASDKEKAALDSRALQSQLMVAALSCHTPERYNSFMRKFRRELSAQHEELGGYFSRRYGGKSENELNRFITKIANESSKRSLRMSSGEFCEATEKLFEKVMESKPKNLYKIAADSRFASLHGIKSCNIFSASN